MLIFSAQYLVAKKVCVLHPQLLTIAEVREDVVGKCVNMFRRIPYGVIPSILYHLKTICFILIPIKTMQR